MVDREAVCEPESGPQRETPPKRQPARSDCPSQFSAPRRRNQTGRAARSMQSVPSVHWLLFAPVVIRVALEASRLRWLRASGAMTVLTGFDAGQNAVTTHLAHLV